MPVRTTRGGPPQLKCAFSGSGLKALVSIAWRRQYREKYVASRGREFGYANYEVEEVQ